ncbi:MAG: hypothetical protein IJ018_01055 [Bacilli bacterium]|nr:hypothetical protein [Bacilli bacterium]
MKTKEIIANELGISRKTLYNYMEELKIKELNEENLKIIEEYVKKKNKSKELSKAELLEELEQLKLKNAELIKQNETLEKGQDVLLQQVEYYRNSIDSEIRQIKQNMTLLLNPPKEEKKSFWDKLFKS